MQMFGVKVLLLVLSLPMMKSQDLTVADVCTSTRSKSVFCNSSDNCVATGIIICYGNQIGEEFLCPDSQANCVVNENGDYCNPKPARNCSDDVDPDLQFQCTGVGYFPDLYDCSSYIYCGLSETGDDYEFTVQKCADGNVYDPNSASFCSRRNIIFNNCIEQTCNVTKLTYNQLSYGFNHLFYALCVPNDANPRIFSCPANSQPNLKGFSPKCEYRCFRSGNFENSLDRTKYFECYFDNFLRLQSIERNCPLRTEFSTTRYKCEVPLRQFRANLTETVDAFFVPIEG